MSGRTSSARLCLAVPLTQLGSGCFVPPCAEVSMTGTGSGCRSVLGRDTTAAAALSGLESCGGFDGLAAGSRLTVAVDDGFATSSCVRFRTVPSLAFLDGSDRGGDSNLRLDGYELFGTSDLLTNAAAPCQGRYFFTLHSAYGGDAGVLDDVVFVRHFNAEGACPALATGVQSCADAWFVDVDVLLAASAMRAAPR